MKSSTPELRALLASRQFYSCGLYSFLCVDGTVLRYTAGDRDITSGGNLFPCGAKSGVLIERGGQQNSLCTWKRGLEVSTLQFDVIPRGATINGLPFLAACKNGFFDGAELSLERAYMPTYGDTSYGTVLMFVGRVAEVDAGRSYATFMIASHLELLNANVPRDIFTPGCLNSVFDGNCGLSRAAFTVNSTVSAGSTESQINAALSNPTGHFDQGVITFTSGGNEGLTRTVKAHVSGSPSTVKLFSPLPVNPMTGDTFTITPGCDHSQATCAAKFSNTPNFRGFPYVPSPILAY